MDIYTPEISPVLFDDNNDDDEADCFVCKFLRSHTEYSSYLNINVYKSKLCIKKVLLVLKFEYIGEFHIKFPKYPKYEDFLILNLKVLF